MISSRTIEEVEYPILIFDLDEIFELIKMTTSIRAKQLENGLDTYAITTDERIFFDTHIKNGSLEIFKVLSSLCLNIEGAYVFKGDDIVETDDDESNSIVYILELPEKWDNNMTINLNSKTLECLQSYIIKEWEDTTKIKTGEEQTYEKKKKELRNIVNIRTEYKKTYRML